MAKLVYDGKINGNDVVYRERCFHGAMDRFEGTFLQNIMEVVTENGKKFRFRVYDRPIFIRDLLAEHKEYEPDFLNEVIIEEKGMKRLSYNSRNISNRTAKGMRIEMIFEKANDLYNGIRQEIMNELKEKAPDKKPKPKPKKLETIILSREEEERILEEVNGLFDTGTMDTCIYKNNTRRFITLFSKIEDKNRKKELLNLIFSCEYENKEVIDWLNKNEADLIREVGLNG